MNSMGILRAAEAVSIHIPIQVSQNKNVELACMQYQKIYVLSGAHRNLCTFGIWEWWEHQMVVDISAASSISLYSILCHHLALL